MKYQRTLSISLFFVLKDNRFSDTFKMIILLYDILIKRWSDERRRRGGEEEIGYLSNDIFLSIDLLLTTTLSSSSSSK